MNNSKENMQAGRLLCKSKTEIEKMSIMDKVQESLASSKDIKIPWIPISMERSSCHQIRALAR